MLRAAKHLAALQDTPGTNAHVARALSAAGDAYAALADWTTALNYYRQASQAWAKFKDEDLRPYRREFEKVQKRVH
jgi:hypothetical protein